jgi:DNA-binding MarR family transcriptional regulator
MNYSAAEQIESETDVLVEQALPLLPQVGKLLYAAVARHPDADGLTLGQIKLTMFLWHGGRRAMGEIADGLGVSMSAASELVDRLVETGMVERATDPADRRKVLVGLTSRAEAFGGRMRAIRRAQLRAALERLAPEERPVFVRSLEALVAALRQDPCEFGPTSEPTLPESPTVEARPAGGRGRARQRSRPDRSAVETGPAIDSTPRQ